MSDKLPNHGRQDSSSSSAVRSERESGKATETWIDWDKAMPFLAAVDCVLNSHTYFVTIDRPDPMSRETFVADVRDSLANAEFGRALEEAVSRKDPGEIWDGGSYEPPEHPDAIGVSMMTPRMVRMRLETMLTCERRFLSFYGKETTPEYATACVDGFFGSFTIHPTFWAEVDPDVLRSWGYLDGFNDGILVAGAVNHLAFLLNNGTD